MNALNHLRKLAETPATWTLLDQSREASDARIAQATVDGIDAAFARSKAARAIASTNRRARAGRLARG